MATNDAFIDVVGGIDVLVESMIQSLLLRSDSHIEFCAGRVLQQLEKKQKHHLPIYVWNRPFVDNRNS